MEWRFTRRFMRQHGIVLWVAAGLFAIALSGCHLTKLQKPKRNTQEFSCGEQCPSAQRAASVETAQRRSDSAPR